MINNFYENVNKSIDKFGNTALIYASRNGDIKTMDKLIKMGADVNLDFGNSTAIEWTIDKCQLSSFIFLIMNGAKYNASKFKDSDWGFYNFYYTYTNGFTQPKSINFTNFINCYELFFHTHKNFISHYEPDFSKFLNNLNKETIME